MARGQALLEYILLIVITIGIATIIIRTLVHRDKNDPGALLAKWNAMMTQIGSDDPNKAGK